jgi:PiT family inorganic phosphate transporter
MNLLSSTALGTACLYGVVSGFNDGGNLLASFTSGRVISPRLAAILLIAALSGPFLMGYAVAATVAANVIDLEGQGPFGFASLGLVAIGVVLFSWRLGIPTSMTLALVGSMIGWVIGGGGRSTIHWQGVARVLVGMPVSVLGGGILALLVYSGVRRLLGRLPHAVVLRLAGLQVAAAAAQALAYGANDLQKTIGLLVVARAFTRFDRSLIFSDGLITLVAFGLFAAGAWLGGSRVARRVGLGVLKIRPMQALSQQLASASVVVLLAAAGAPVSMTQTIDGGLVGVGAAHRASGIRWGVVREMLSSWLVTLPLAMVLAAAVHAALAILGIAR